MNPAAARAWKAWRKSRDFAIAATVAGAVAVLRLLPVRVALEGADRLGRLIGPRTPFHATALKHLRRSFPDRSEVWIEATARAHWGQLARLGAEYVFLDELFDFDPANPSAGRVEVEGVEIFEELRDRKGPFVFFTGHLGPFELLPVAAATFDLQVTALFQPPPNRYLAKRLLAARRTRGGHLVPSKAGAAWALMERLQQGGSVGILVDQKFKRGVQTTFFGRKCWTNPLVPKLARQFGCEVYPARSIRLPDGRYRLELKPRLDLPRDAGGEIDVAASCQVLNDMVEAWVREQPEQWTWFYRRW
ncbi:lipid A biosynthesis lauroyl acyltransferase [Aureimonas leprariae]|uniref:Lipid A biosynthesis lauroyl acyltransferase n=1 Tax=Plantimonas leprariae TaxID=2615207 RepID=A0A7V7PS79_9HYPH|nr:lipid A biosynthesis lauroyl acyltransferase [Aureimonas leprariae]KAB0681900.1 lipid A biosynthesis lauroyl acyltransferase [Aureimonas leprariae]